MPDRITRVVHTTGGTWLIHESEWQTWFLGISICLLLFGDLGYRNNVVSLCIHPVRLPSEDINDNVLTSHWAFHNKRWWRCALYRDGVSFADIVCLQS